MALENKISPCGRNDNAVWTLMLLKNQSPPAPLSFRAKREIFLPQDATTKISPSGRNDSLERDKVHQPFGSKLNAIIEELNETLAA